MIRHLGACISVAAVFLGLSCAPQDDAPRPGRNDKDGPSPIVHLANAPLKDRLTAALQHVHDRDLTTSHAFWTIFHGVLGMGLETELVDAETRKKIKFVDAIRIGEKIRGMEFIPSVDGVDVRIVEGSGAYQGHQDQFIAEMIQWGMPLSQKFMVGGEERTFADFCRFSKAKASVLEKPKQELSWAIIVVSEMFGTDHQWTNRKKEKLHLEDVVRYELNEPIADAACGGTHRLFGLTWAYHRHRERGGKAVGVWKDVVDKIAEYKHNAKKYRNASDGSFSSNYVSKPGHAKDVQGRIGSTGHTLEWLALALTDAELRQPWMEEAAIALCNMILENSSREIDGGSLYHATHGLHIYYDRLFGAFPGHPRPIIPLPPKS